MAITKLRHVAAFAAALITASCVQHHAAPPEDPAPTVTITFRNQSRDRVQVYLIGDKEDWLLGRLESLQTAHLRLPESAFLTTQPVMLAVVPVWSRNLQPRRDPRAILSIKQTMIDWPGMEWIFVGGQLQGPLRAQPRGRF